MCTRGVAPPRTAPEDTFLSVRRSEAVSARDREPLLVPNKRESVLVPHARHAHTHPPRRAGAQYRAGYGAGPLESALRQSREQPPERSWPTRMWPLTGFRPPDIVGSRRGSNPRGADHLLPLQQQKRCARRRRSTRSPHTRTPCTRAHRRALGAFAGGRRPATAATAAKSCPRPAQSAA